MARASVQTAQRVPTAGAPEASCQHGPQAMTSCRDRPAPALPQHCKEKGLADLVLGIASHSPLTVHLPSLRETTFLTWTLAAVTTKTVGAECPAHQQVTSECRVAQEGAWSAQMWGDLCGSESLGGGSRNQRFTVSCPGDPEPCWTWTATWDPV